LQGLTKGDIEMTDKTLKIILLLTLLIAIIIPTILFLTDNNMGALAFIVSFLASAITTSITTRLIRR